VVLCLFTTFDSQDVSTRVEIQPTEGNGLMQPSYVMTDKIVTVDRAMLGERIGALDSRLMEAISAKLAFVLGLSKTP
jgi:mRNA interferase MazF